MANNVRHNSAIIGYAVIIAISLTMAFFVNMKSQKDYAYSIERYQNLSQKEAEEAASRISYSFKQIYQGIRTISLLPSVKNIDRYGKSLDTNAHAAIEQIYHNMVSNVDVSEIYIVPVDIEPEQIDKETGNLQEPILMYDGKEQEPDNSTEANKEPEPKIDTIEKAEKKEEVEIYEYRVLKEHMTYLKQNFPNNKNIDKLNLPFISGRQVLTCDNNDYEKTHNDADRTGLVMSVPFYSDKGDLKGTITAVVRNNTIMGMLPTTNAALINDTYNYTLMAKNAGQQQQSEEWIKQSQKDPSLIFSSLVPVETTDSRSKWNIWVGYPDSKFIDSSDAKAIQNFKLAGYVLSAIVAVFCSIVWGVIQRSARVVRNKVIELEDDVRKRTAEMEKLAAEQEAMKQNAEKQKREILNKMADDFEHSVSNVVSQVASSAAQMQSSAENVTHIAYDTKKRSAVVANAANSTAQIASQVSGASGELSSAIREISVQTQKSNEVSNQANSMAHDAQKMIASLAEKSTNVAKVIDVITGIAGQINLLALNATIESARAGEAGKGFAVVAGEVKNLASQVAKATEEISTQITEMEEATSLSVNSVKKIISIISQVSESTNSVAAAVEEQTAVTSEIVGSITMASNGTREISNNISSVQEGADKTGETAKQLLDSANNLKVQSDTLKNKVDDFLRMIRK